MLPGGGMSEYLGELFNGTFWIGAGLVVAIWGLLEAINAHRRRQLPAPINGNRTQNTTDGLDIGVVAENAKIRPFAHSLYVGSMGINFSTLHDGYVEIWAKAFNGTGREIKVDRLYGNVRYRQLPESHHGDEWRVLRIPHLLYHRSKLVGIEDGEEFLVVIEQRIHPELADHLNNTTSRKDGIFLRFSEIEITVRAQDQPDISARLPLWGGLTVFREPNELSTGRLLTGGDMKMGIIPLTHVDLLIPLDVCLDGASPCASVCHKVCGARGNETF